MVSLSRIGLTLSRHGPSFSSLAFLVSRQKPKVLMRSFHSGWARIPTALHCLPSTIFVLLSNPGQSLCEDSSSFVFYMCSLFLSQELLRTPHSLLGSRLLHSSSLQTSKKKAALKWARDLNRHITKKDIQIFN